MPFMCPFMHQPCPFAYSNCTFPMPNAFHTAGMNLPTYLPRAHHVPLSNCKPATCQPHILHIPNHTCYTPAMCFLYTYHMPSAHFPQPARYLHTPAKYLPRFPNLTTQLFTQHHAFLSLCVCVSVLFSRQGFSLYDCPGTHSIDQTVLKLRELRDPSASVS